MNKDDNIIWNTECQKKRYKGKNFMEYNERTDKVSYGADIK